MYPIRTFLFVLLALGAWSLSAAEFHVAPTGDDAANDGTSQRPFRSIERARDAVRTQKAGEVTVWFEPGVYPQTRPVEFDQRDARPAGSPVDFRARVPGTVVLDAARHVAAAEWEKPADGAVARLPEMARARVVALDLAKAGLPALKPFPVLFTDSGGLFDLYSDGERLEIARWPNTGEAVMATVIDKGGDKRGTNPLVGGTFTYRENRVSRWAPAAERGELWLGGIWYAPWIYEVLRVAKLDPAAKRITLATGVSGSLGSRYAGPEGSGAEPWHVVNLLEELDRPGEWCVDFRTQTLFVWPPNGTDADLAIAYRDTPVLRFQKAAHLVLRGIIVEGGLGNGIEINDSTNCRIEGCTVRRVGRNAIVVSRGHTNQILSCDLHTLGHGGIVMGGGDRLALAPAGHVADNNEIHRNGLSKRMYTPGIALGAYGAAPAVGCVVTHNRIHDSPHGGILYGGNDNLFAFNEIFDVVKDSDDMGAFYTCHDWTSHGNIVRHNFVHHAPRATGVYLDDGDSGDLVEGNLFYRTMCGPFIGGGHDNLAIGNVALSCGRGAHIDARGLDRGYGTEAQLFKQLATAHVEQPPWCDRYPSLATLASSEPALPRSNVIERTVAVGCESVMHYGGKSNLFERCRITNNHELALADMGFIDAAGLDFRMAADAPVFRKVPGFRAIPFAQIGLYTNELRPTLPPRATGFSRAVIVEGKAGKAVASSLAVESPAYQQVFQRDARGMALVELRGSVSPAVTEVRYRMGGQPLVGEFPDAWVTVPVDAATHIFAVEIPVPAGGWYRMEILACDAGQIIGQWTVDRFGVGEVFIVAGQSNAGNYGSEKQKTATRDVVTFDGRQWHLCEDPQRGAAGKGGSFLPAFGDALSVALQMPVAVVPLAMGGTSVREWLPAGSRMKQQPTTGQNVKKVAEGEWEATGKLFASLTNRIAALGPQGFRAVLWHQGESDAGQARGGYPADRQITGAQYTEFMRVLIRASRTAAGWDVPWFVAQTTYHSEKDPADEEFRAAQAALWKDGFARPGPDTDALRGPLRDGVHFNAAGLRKHGELWAEKILPMVARP